MADPKPNPLLKRGGKFVKRDGKLVRTDDPSTCPCCGDCEYQNCFDDDQPRIVTLEIVPEGKKLKWWWEILWNPPDDCSVENLWFEFRIFSFGGMLLRTIKVDAKRGLSEHRGHWEEDADDACANDGSLFFKLRARLIDKKDICEPGPWDEKDNGIGPSDEICRECQTDEDCGFCQGINAPYPEWSGLCPELERQCAELGGTYVTLNPGVIADRGCQCIDIPLRPGTLDDCIALTDKYGFGFAFIQWFCCEDRCRETACDPP